jgi:hypothetical protein
MIDPSSSNIVCPEVFDVESLDVLNRTGYRQEDIDNEKESAPNHAIFQNILSPRFSLALGRDLFRVECEEGERLEPEPPSFVSA